MKRVFEFSNNGFTLVAKVGSRRSGSGSGGARSDAGRIHVVELRKEEKRRRS